MVSLSADVLNNCLVFGPQAREFVGRRCALFLEADQHAGDGDTVVGSLVRTRLSRRSRAHLLSVLVKRIKQLRL